MLENVGKQVLYFTRRRVQKGASQSKVGLGMISSLQREASCFDPCSQIGQSRRGLYKLACAQGCPSST
jgi:hypothetical protein